MQLFHKDVYLQEKNGKSENEITEVKNPTSKSPLQSVIQCKLCEKIFPQQHQMLYHFYNEHKCKKCEFSGNSQDLIDHQSVHAIKPCGICGKDFRSDLMEKHIQLSHMPKPAPVPSPVIAPVPPKMPRKYTRRQPRNNQPAPFVMPPLIPLEDLGLGFT